MPKKIYISLAALTGLGIGAFLAVKPKKSTTQNSDLKDIPEEDSYTTAIWTEAEKKTLAYQKLLSKWGTKEGVMHVRDNSFKSKKKQIKERLRKLSKIQKKGKQLVKEQKHKLGSKAFNNLKDLSRHFQVTQVCVTNHTDAVQPITLWGGNSALSDTTTVAEAQNYTKEVGVHPQNAVYNPANNLFYIVNQLSDSVSVLNSTSEIIATVSLNLTGFMGGVSPVDLVVNSNIESSYYGHVYVIGSVSNTVYEIDFSHEVIVTYSTGKRPMSIAYSAVNDSLYIANLVSNDITHLALTTRVQTQLTGYYGPIAIGVHQQTGNIYLLNNKRSLIQIIDPVSYRLLKAVAGISTYGRFFYHPKNERVYFSITDADHIACFDAVTHENQGIKVGQAPLSMAYDSSKELLYVANKTDQSYSLVSLANEVVETIVAPAPFSNGLAININAATFLSTHLNSNSVFLQNTMEAPVVTFDEDYEENRKNFQHNPALLEHIKVINSGTQKLNSLQQVTTSITGKQTSTSYSFRNYDSPQHFGNVSELTDMRGQLIDGRNSWHLKVPAKQKLTLLFYHKQMEVYDLLPETSRKSIGVQMSKGLPKHWK